MLPDRKVNPPWFYECRHRWWCMCHQHILQVNFNLSCSYHQIMPWSRGSSKILYPNDLGAWKILCLPHSADRRLTPLSLHQWLQQHDEWRGLDLIFLTCAPHFPLSNSWSLLSVRQLGAVALCRGQGGFYMGEIVLVRTPKKKNLLCY